MGLEEVLSAPRSPWQRAYVERVIGTIRRECLDHVIVFHEADLYHHLKSFVVYYQESRTHLALDKDTPEPRPLQSAELGGIVAIPQVGGLHHRYERRAALVAPSRSNTVISAPPIVLLRDRPAGRSPAQPWV